MIDRCSEIRSGEPTGRLSARSGWWALARRAAAPARNRRGATLVVVAAGMMVAIATMAVALESGRMYLYRARFVRAADAGALAAVRAIRQGQDAAREAALAVTEANGLADGQGGVTVEVEFGTAPTGEETVTLNAMMPVPYVFSVLFGRETLSLRSTATAAVAPIDLVLVLDQSGSLKTGGAWDDLQKAVKEFVKHFKEDYDQVGMVSFHLRAVHRIYLGEKFSAGVPSKVNVMKSEGGTNTGDGLMYALQQMRSQAVRDGSVKVVVLFTDGQPTIYRGTFGGKERLLAANQYLTNQGRFYNSSVGGYWNDPESLPTDKIPTRTKCESSTTCFGLTVPQIVEAANQRGRDMAAQLRAEGVYVYTIALDDPLQFELTIGGKKYMIDLIPDMDYVRGLANENGVADPDQPQGRAYYAPTPSDLERVFNQVAQDIKVRLSF